jgi:hypothetical protein
VRHISERGFEGAVRDVVRGCAGYAHQPEILPRRERRDHQRTEEIVGEYALPTFSFTTSWIPAAGITPQALCAAGV